MKARASALSFRWPALGVWWLVTPLLAQAPGQDLMPLPHPEIAPPVIPSEPISWWLLAGGIVAALVLVALVVWLLFVRKAEARSEAVSPLKVALGRLSELEKELGKVAPDEFAHRVSVILRDYLQARYAVPAPYRTTQELYGNAFIQARDSLRERFGPVAEFYDRLEFAPQPADRVDCIKLMEEAVRSLRDEKRYTPDVLPPPLPTSSPSLPFVPKL